MTESEFENRLIDAVEDCAKSLRVQCKIMQDRNFLLEETNAQTAENIKLYRENSEKNDKAMQNLSNENLEKIIKTVLIEYIREARDVNQKSR